MTLRRMLLGWTSVASAFLALPSSACDRVQDQQADSHRAILVNATWLAEHLDDPSLVIFHVGDSTDYAIEHIPGAHHVTRDMVSRPQPEDPDALVLELPAPAELEALLETLGVGDDSRVVVYWDGDRLSRATRVVLTLDWAGLGDRTALLDGGLEAWKTAGHPLTNEIPTATTTNLTLSPRPELIVDAEFVAHVGERPGLALVDARTHEYYSGEREGQVKTGHIPGAGNADWREMVDDSLRFKPADEVASVFASAGVEPGNTVVAYCHIGQYATATLFAARVLGYEVRLYDGSFQDWAARDLPVETDSR